MFTWLWLLPHVECVVSLTRLVRVKFTIIINTRSIVEYTEFRRRYYTQVRSHEIFHLSDLVIPFSLDFWNCREVVRINDYLIASCDDSTGLLVVMLLDWLGRSRTPWRCLSSTIDFFLRYICRLDWNHGFRHGRAHLTLALSFLGAFRAHQLQELGQWCIGLG